MVLLHSTVDGSVFWSIALSSVFTNFRLVAPLAAVWVLKGWNNKGNGDGVGVGVGVGVGDGDG